MNALLSIAGQASAWRNALTGGGAGPGPRQPRLSADAQLATSCFRHNCSSPRRRPAVTCTPALCPRLSMPHASSASRSRPKAVVPNEPLRLLVDTADSTRHR